MMSPVWCQVMPQVCRAAHTVMAAPPLRLMRLTVPLMVVKNASDSIVWREHRAVNETRADDIASRNRHVRQSRKPGALTAPD